MDFVENIVEIAKDIVREVRHGAGFSRLTDTDVLMLAAQIQKNQLFAQANGLGMPTIKTMEEKIEQHRVYTEVLHRTLDLMNSASIDRQ